MSTMHDAQEAILDGLADKYPLSLVWVPPEEGARVDPKNMIAYIPYMDPNNRTQVDIMGAFVAHEVSHITRNSDILPIRNDKALVALYRYVDDIRCNYTYGRGYLDGTWRKILVAHAYHAKLARSNKVKAGAMDDVMYDAFMIAHDLQGEATFANPQNKYMVDHIVTLMQPIMNRYATNDDSIAVCKAIKAYLESQKQQQPKDTQPQYPTNKAPQDGPPDGSGQGAGNESVDDAINNEDKPDNTQGTGNPGDDDEEGDAESEGTGNGDADTDDDADTDGTGDGDGDSDSNSDSEGSGDTGTNDTAGSAGRGKGGLDDLTGSHVMDSIAKALNDITKDNSTMPNDAYHIMEIRNDIPHNGPPTDRLDPELQRMRKHLIRALRAHGAMYDDANRGRICARKIVNVAMGKRNIFRKRREDREVDTAVAIVLDCSSSMSWDMLTDAYRNKFRIGGYTHQFTEKRYVAAQVCGAVALACRDAGADTMLIGFSYDAGIGWRFGEKLNQAQLLQRSSRTAYSGCGGTMPRTALELAVERLGRVKCERRLMIVITDGDICDRADCEEVVRKAHRIHTVGIGIGQEAESELFINTNSPFVKVRKPEELSREMFKQVGLAMGADSYVRVLSHGGQ